MKPARSIPGPMRTLPLVLMAAALLLVPLASAKVERPTPTIGDHWETVSTVPGPDGGEQEAVARDTVTAFESVTIEGQAYDAVRTEMFTNSTTGSGEFSMTMSSHITSWTRRSDGAALRTVSRMTYGGFAGIPASEMTSETTYLEPCLHMQFPMDVGDSWEVDCQTRTTTSSSFPGQPATDTTVNETYRVRVLRAERVTVDAGTFDTLVTEWNSTSEGGSTTYYQWYAPAACSNVRTAFDEEGLNMSTELRAFRCASPGSFSAGGSTSATPSGTPAGGTTPTATGTPPAGGATPTSGAGASPTTGASPAPTGNTTGRSTDTPGLPGVALLGAMAVGALAMRRKVR